MNRVYISLSVMSLLILVGLLFSVRSTRLAANHANSLATCQTNAGELLGDINAERFKLGSPALTIDPALVVSSQGKLQDMVANHYYGHDLLDGSPPWHFFRDQGVYAAINEDLDIDANSPELDWTALKNSPAHYKSLTDPSLVRVGITTECVSYPIEHSTGPDNNTNLVGQTASELSVIHLAAAEPAKSVQKPETVRQEPVVCVSTPAVATVPAMTTCR